VIGGRLTGSIMAESRLELQATCVMEGKIQARRIKLEEGGKVNGPWSDRRGNERFGSGAAVCPKARGERPQRAPTGR
jgi:cytoskeletal protein CcmA (bactofilin family)